MKDYAALIPTATAKDVRWLVWEAADKREIGFADFRRIVKAAERRLDEIERLEGSNSRLHPAGDSGDHLVRAEGHVKQKGWPECFLCDLWRHLSQQCGAINKDGLSPCEVMSRKMYKYLRKEE